MTTYKSIKYNFSGSDLEGVVSQPTVTSITPSSTTEGNLPLASVVIAGTGFTPGSTVSLIGASGTTVAVPTVAFNSSTQLTVTIPSGLGGLNEDPFDVKVSNAAAGQGDNLFSVDDNPIFATPAGTIGSIVDSGRAAPAYTLSPVTATDPEGVTVTYALVAPGPALSPGLSFDTTNAAITGTADAVPADTTTTFRVRATAGAQSSDRDFSITVKKPVQEYLTTAGAGTYAITHSGNVKLLVVGGGGSGTPSGYAGGGGAGGMVDHPSYAVTPQTYNFYIGAGGDYTAPTSGNPDISAAGNTVTRRGQNSNWGTATGDLVTTASVIGAIGGGPGSSAPHSDGGSGGGRSHSNGPGGSALQGNSPLISADSKTHGYGNNGGSAPYSNPSHGSGGGGGAGGAGNSGGANNAGSGGAGRSVSATYGSATNSGSFCGGGGGGTHSGGSGGSSGGSGAGNGVATGNTNRGNAAAVNSGSGGGSGNSGGSGVIGIAF